jgi:hypothetical protein
VGAVALLAIAVGFALFVAVTVSAKMRDRARPQGSAGRPPMIQIVPVVEAQPSAVPAPPERPR